MYKISGDEKMAAMEPAASRRKEQILDAATLCFSQKGFHRSSLAHIAAVAGMSPGHIYHYYKSKEDIVAAIVARERNESEQILTKAQSVGGDTSGAALFLCQLAQGLALHKDPARASLTMEILAEASRNPVIAEVVQRNNAELHQSLYQLLGDRCAKTRSKMEIIGALMSGLSIRALRNPQLDQDLDEEMLGRVIKFILSEES